MQFRIEHRDSWLGTLQLPLRIGGGFRERSDLVGVVLRGPVYRQLQLENRR